MDYGKVLTRSWEIIWKHKILWLFGILAGCGSQQGFNFRGSGNTGYQFGNGDVPPNISPDVQRFFYRMERFFEQNGEIIILLIIGLFVLVMLLVFLFSLIRTFGSVGLIQGALRAEKEAETLTFSQVYEDITPFFWRVFLLNFLVGLVFLTVGLVFAIIAFLGIGVTFGFGMFCLVPLICLLVPVFWYISFVLVQANIALVAEDLTIFKALERGWDLCRTNLGSVIVMGIILTVGTLVISFIIAIPQLMALAPLMAGIFSGILMEEPGVFLGGLGITVICLVLLSPLFILLRGVLLSYVQSAWTLTYLEITGGPQEEGEPALPAETPA